MKKPQKRNAAARDIEDAGPLDWAPLFAAFKEAFEWALDVAAQLARDYPEEVEAVERVRTFMRKRIAGEMPHVKVEDVLFAFGLIIGSIERDLGTAAHFGPWFAARMRFPGAHELWERAIPRHVTGLSIRVEGDPS